MTADICRKVVAAARCRMSPLLFLLFCFIAQTLGGKQRQQHVCLQQEFRCKHREECIPASRVCDGYRDCRDGADEDLDFCGKKNQTDGCTSEEFRCSFGGCIMRNASCNGRVDCFDGSDESLECRKQTCSSRQFRCDYGACISLRFKCDGHTNCVDHTDETHESCRNHSCQPNQFRCRYGACVNARKLCDGRRHCRDRSDENKKLCSKILRSIIRANATGATTIFAGSGAAGKCLVSCHPLRPPRGIESECVDPKTHQVMSCRSPIIPVGTVARYHCAPNFRPIGTAGKKSDKVCGPDGKWKSSNKSGTREALTCALECGLAREGKKWPWLMELAVKDGDEWSQRCTATLVSDVALITAASCLQRKQDNSTYQTVKPRDVRVIFYDGHDDHIQVDEMHVRSLTVHPNFTMTEESDAKPNLAVIQLRHPLHHFDRILPVCISKREGSLLEDIHLLMGSNGTVPMMQLDEHNSLERRNLSELSMGMQIALMERCTNDTQDQSSNYCATLPEGSEECKIPIGSGMVFPTGSDDDRRWVLHGILLPHVNPCDSSRRFIRIGQYLTWLDGYLGRVMRP